MHRVLTYLLIASPLLMCCASAHAAAIQLGIGSTSVQVQAPDGYAAARITMSLPDGQVLERDFKAVMGPHLNLGVAHAGDGTYRYRIEFTGPVLSRSDGNGAAESPASGRTSRAKLRTWPPVSGQFAVVSGKLVDGAAVNTESKSLQDDQMKDQVILDDLIVVGSACVGQDCVNGEAFGFDTLRLKENNLRMKFEDTSNSASFPSDDWQLIANDTTNGGQNRFSIENVTAGTTPFSVIGSAPSNSLVVDDNGNVGLGTATPVLELHLRDGDTPSIRLEQDTSGGYPAQTWDVAGNETNFFIRDASNGSQLPLRIRPAAPTNSLYVAANGDIGLGSASPAAKLDVYQSAPLASPVPGIRLVNNDGSVPAGTTDRFTVDSSGNVTARGTISQLSSRTAKENFADAEGPILLAKLETLRVPTWNYRGARDQVRHIGPVAEDFHAAFDVGADPRFLAPADVAGVALASVKALQDQVKQRDERIAGLEARLARLEALLAQSN